MPARSVRNDGHSASRTGVKNLTSRWCDACPLFSVHQTVYADCPRNGDKPTSYPVYLDELMLTFKAFSGASGSQTPVLLASGRIDCGDTMGLIARVPSCSIDLLIADIPYFGIIDAEWANQWNSITDYLDWLDGLFGHFARVLKNGAACYVYSAITLYPYVQLLLNKHLAYAATITWKKQRGRGNGWGFNREEICVNVKGVHAFRPVESSTLMLPHLRKGKIDYSNRKRTMRRRDYKLATCVWDDIPQVCCYRKQLHPTEKPVENARRMIEASSDRGHLVLIPFLGSGSEAEACFRLHRNFLGFEASTHYCQIAVERMLGVAAHFSELAPLPTIESPLKL
jgi:DNA modification methylase